MKGWIGMIKKVLVILLALLVIIGLFLGGMTLLEYRPKDRETLSTIGTASSIQVETKKEYSITSFNIGYGALGETEDFFMDGGKTIRPKDKALVENNLKHIKEKLVELDSDFLVIQEVDEDSKRSHNINQVEELLLNNMAGSFAYNFKVPYVPFPFPPIGKVNSGLLSMAKYAIKDSERVSLPNPFSWPLRTANLKRAMLVTRYPIQDKGKYLVVINFHLEAYDSGEGKIAQTKLLSEIISKEYEKGNYVIAGGDWNQTLVKDLQADPTLLTEWTAPTVAWDSLPKWEMGVDAKTPTNRSLIRPYIGNKDKLAKFFIDGFIVSPNIQILDTKVAAMDFKYSDHEPVQMRFVLLD
ncbi:MAG TPA: endonuclease/exonuclease/phosphatase family protein [Sphaerochaeta sp.]|nr:endonuclease/exonuclease/phosphatase family protein [Sphaerochaeta sp.]